MWKFVGNELLYTILVSDMYTSMQFRYAHVEVCK